MSDLGSEVRRRAGGRCEYCKIPESAFRRPFHIEHIVAKQHGGQTHLDNLAFACSACNFKKGPNLTGIDPATGQLTPLFDPRRQRWTDHFALSAAKPALAVIEVQGLTATGRTTVRLLAMNIEVRGRIRYELWREGVALS